MRPHGDVRAGLRHAEDGHGGWRAGTENTPVTGLAAQPSRTPGVHRATLVDPLRAAVPTAAGLLALAAVSVAVRVGAMHSGYWTDEAISIGVASHPLHDIPGVLREDGSPPLYYLLLHAWIRLVGTGEPATRSLSLIIALAGTRSRSGRGGRCSGPAPAGWRRAGRPRARS